MLNPAYSATFTHLRNLVARFRHGVGRVDHLLGRAGTREHSDVYSFDVFDTLLRRRVDPPELTKSLVAQHISNVLARSGIQISREAIVTERNNQEMLLQKQAVAAGGDPVACLDDIMKSTLVALQVDAVLDSRQVVDYEVALEKTAAEPMPGAAALLAHLRALGRRIIVISDTYLSTSQMQSLLEHHSLLKYVDEVYVSSAVGMTKGTGRLFRYVIENEGSTIVHIGDNYKSDYVVPRSLGIKSFWLESRDEGRRKKRLRRLLAGQNRMEYVNAIVESAERNSSVLYSIGHDVLGPALTVFIHCVAERARQNNIDRIFFVARDGFVMKKIYHILQTSIYADASFPPAKYLCLSRLAVRSASLGVKQLSRADVEEAFAYMTSRKKTTLADILGGYGLEPDWFAPIAHKHRLNIHEPILDPADDSIIAFLQDSAFKQVTLAKGRTATELLREYLANTGFIGGGRIALVDANSEGLTQSLMTEVFALDKDYPTVHGYYFNLLNKRGKNTGTDWALPAAAGVVGDWRSHSEVDLGAFERLGMLIELLSHPSHGLTTGYRKVNGRILPVFRQTPQETQYHLTSQALQGILDYARAYASRHALHNYKSEDLLQDARANIKDWAAFPPRAHTTALGRLFLTSDWPAESQHAFWRDTATSALAKRISRLLHRTTSWRRPYREH